MTVPAIDAAPIVSPGVGVQGDVVAALTVSEKLVRPEYRPERSSRSFGSAAPRVTRPTSSMVPSRNERSRRSSVTPSPKGSVGFTISSDPETARFVPYSTVIAPPTVPSNSVRSLAVTVVVPAPVAPIVPSNVSLPPPSTVAELVSRMTSHCTARTVSPGVMPVGNVTKGTSPGTRSSPVSGKSQASVRSG